MRAGAGGHLHAPNSCFFASGRLLNNTHLNNFVSQVLVATSTLAWGVNTPAHLVIIKGTEFYDAPTK